MQRKHSGVNEWESEMWFMPLALSHVVVTRVSSRRMNLCSRSKAGCSSPCIAHIRRTTQALFPFVATWLSRRVNNPISLPFRASRLIASKQQGRSVQVSGPVQRSVPGPDSAP